MFDPGILTSSGLKRSRDLSRHLWSTLLTSSAALCWQIVCRQTWKGTTTELETSKASVELQVPSEGYLIEIKALSRGGDGTSSGPIHIPKMDSKFQTVGRRKRNSSLTGSFLFSQKLTKHKCKKNSFTQFTMDKN